MNFKHFFYQHSFVVAFMLCLMLNVLSAVVPFLKYISAVIFIACIFYFDINKSLGILFLFIFTEAVVYMTEPEPFSFIFLAVLIVLNFVIPTIKMFINSEVKWNLKTYLPLIFCVAILFLSIFVDITHFQLTSLRYFGFLLVFYCAFLLRNKFRIVEIFRYFYTALIATCLFSVIFIVAHPYDIYSFHQDEFNYFRFKGLTGHENTLYVYALTIIMMGMFFYFKKKIKFGEFIGISIICVILGFLTCSKTFLILILLACALFFCFSFKYKPRRFVEYEFIVFAFVFLFGFLAMQANMFTLFDRFFLYFKDGNILNMLTTGRYDIYARFIDMWSANFWTVTFGIGANYMLTDYVHCFYLEWLAKFGLIGASLVIGFFVSIALCVNKKDLRIVNFLPLALMSLMLLVDEFFSCKIIAVVLCVLCIISPLSCKELNNDDLNSNNLEQSKEHLNKLAKKEIKNVHKIKLNIFKIKKA